MKKREFIRNINKTWYYVKDCRSNLVFYGLLIIAEALIGATLPLLGAKIILNITSKVIDQLILSSLIVFIVEFTLYVVYYFQGFFFQKIYRKTLNKLQITVAKETLKIEIKEMDKTSSGVFIDRLNKDTEEISSMFMYYTYWLSYVISNLGILVAVYILNRPFFIYCLLTSVAVFLINKKRISKQYEVQKKIKILQEKKTGLTGEIVRGIRDIKVLNATDNVLDKTSSKIIEASKEEQKMMNIKRVYQYLENNIRSFSDFIFIILGCYLYNKNLLTVPAFVILYNYQGKIKSLLTGIVQLIEYNKKFVVSSSRIFEIIDNDKFQKEKFGNEELKKLKGKIEFNDVTFGYNDQTIIKNMNFIINPNETVAFVGKSGAGKTTIFNLIAKLYSSNSGNILLDNIDINNLDCNSIRNNMSIITQDPYIFNFSIKDNLLLVKKDATDEEIKEVCKIASIDEYIMSLPEKYDTIIGENGIIFSGGQKQRLAIARALLKKTEIILFDEATSALDNETQKEIQKAINNIKGEYTILIIAHRLSTIIDSNKIFVVDNGQIIASGTHKELLVNCEFYQHLYEKDFEINI